MTDRNTTVVTDGGSGGLVLGIFVAVVAGLAILVFAFGWQPWNSAPANGPDVNITTPAPAPAPTTNIIVPAPEAAPAPAPAQ